VIIVETFGATRALRHGQVGLVPTMGYLHEGHLSLAHAARRESDTVVMSLFVNPLQFAPTDDLASYPRDVARDAALAEAAGVDVLFAPSVEEMYARPPSTEVTVASVSAALEGLHRPGHFEGVATVVTKLFAGIQPDRAYFGRKDAQQLAVIKRLVRDLSFPVHVTGCPIVREAEGLALSSRNTYLSTPERSAALSLSRGLMAAADAAEAGERSADRLGSLVVGSIEAAAAAGPVPIEVEYVALADTNDVLVLGRLDRPAFLAVAARVGRTRLIDNVHFDEAGGGFTADRGIPVDTRSILYGEEG
jgi:pantoate--beta-alanine ligase